MSAGAARIALEAAYRVDARRVLATLIRLLGSFEQAEEAMHEAFAAAAAQWPTDGVPANPYSWLVSAGRFRTISRWRSEGRRDRALAELAVLSETAATPMTPEWIADDELRLIFICCHPDLPADARVALTLREVCRLTTEEVARAYLTSTPTIAQRIVRAKTRIRDRGIAYELPPPAALEARLASVIEVVYLVFNEGYSAAQGAHAIRGDLCDEAIRLGRLLTRLVRRPEVDALLALMLFHDSRRATRIDRDGDVVLLEDQDRSRWDAARIDEAQTLMAGVLATGAADAITLQAAIAGAHCVAPSFAATDWHRIVDLYDRLLRTEPTPVVALNRAVAVSMRDGAEAGLAQLDAVLTTGALDRYHLAHAARADMQRRLGQQAAAMASYRRAIDLAGQAADRRLLERRLAAVAAAAGEPTSEPARDELA